MAFAANLGRLTEGTMPVSPQFPTCLLPIRITPSCLWFADSRAPRFAVVMLVGCALVSSEVFWEATSGKGVVKTHMESGRLRLIMPTVTVGLLMAAVGLVTVDSTLAGGSSHGQTVYVPAYSYVRIGEKGHVFQLAATLIIRNTDVTRPMTVVGLDYYDNDGKKLRAYVEAPVTVKPLAAVHFYVKPSDISGGLAPSFIARWKSGEAISEPIIEAVMIGDKSGQGISLVCNGKVIKEGPD
jgi:hypothetical protein